MFQQRYNRHHKARDNYRESYTFHQCYNLQHSEKTGSCFNKIIVFGWIQKQHLTRLRRSVPWPSKYNVQFHLICVSGSNRTNDNSYQKIIICFPCQHNQHKPVPDHHYVKPPIRSYRTLDSGKLTADMDV